MLRGDDVAVVGTSDDEEAVGWASDADSGELVPTNRSSKQWTLFHTRPRRRMWHVQVCRDTEKAAPRHHLRTRKLSQIHPYTVEALRYRRELYANDWQDAVVSQREWRHLRIPERDTHDLGSWTAQAERSSSPSLIESQLERASSPAPASPPPPSPTSSEDSTDYERRFRVLKRMMPAHMARACIDDLRAMRHGDVESDSETERARSPSPPQELQPGESRRRIRAHDGPPAPLLSDASSSEDEVHEPSLTLHDTDLRWWAVPKRAASPVREGDVIDRMLARTETRKSRPRRKGFGQTAKRAAPTGPHRRRPVAVPAWIQASEQSEPPPRLYGLPTKRADLGAHARLPYIPGPQSTLSVAHEVRTTVPMSTATRPRPVSRLAPTPMPSAPPHVIPREWERAPPEWHDELQELLAWDGVQHIQWDFGILSPPVGLSFAPDTDLARGRLHELLHLSPATSEPPPLRVYERTLHVWMSLEEVASALLGLSLDDQRSTLDLCHFLGTWFTWQASLAHTTQPIALTTFDAQAACDALCMWAQDLLDRPCSPDLVLRLLWFRVCILWRAIHAGTTTVTHVTVLEAAYPLLLRLMSMGVSHTADALTTHGAVDDAPAEMWVCIIHLLHTIDAQAFWDVWDPALEEWLSLTRSSPLVACERTWYTLFVICALSHFHASTGMAGHSSYLHAHWPGVQRLVSRIKLRFDERVERAAPRVLLQRRDAYIHLLLRRCFLLCTRWSWSLEHADAILNHWFDVFNAHRLADLPTETDHDFAPFLRRFDVSLLYAEPSGTAYQQFLQLLGRASHVLSTADDAQRRLALLFSRMTPVRVMAFTHDNPPISSEFAMLFNHYSLVMLFLYFEPQSALQRLRQIRSFLSFSRADRSSQIACIRAVVYAGVLFRHHGLDTKPIVVWLVDVLHTLQASMHQDRDTSELFSARRADQITREVTRMIAVLIRSVHHLVTHASMNAGKTTPYPPLGLLHPAWTDQLIRSGDMAPEVANEVLGLIRVYLDTRASSVQLQASTDDDEEFDDTWWTDPGLAALLGEDPQPPIDTQLAEQLHTQLSPALFQWLMSGGPSTPRSISPLERLMAHAEEDERYAMVVDNWASCAHVLVYHRRRAWHAYLTLGHESWKRISHPIRKRDVAVRFVVRMAHLDQAAFVENVTECIAIWFQCMAAFRVTMQPALTRLLARHADVFHGVHAEDDADAFCERRAALLQQVLTQMQMAYAPSQGFVIQCVSALLSSIRAYTEHVHDEAYWSWCRDTLLAMSTYADGRILRGIRTELHTTLSYLEKPFSSHHGAIS